MHSAFTQKSSKASRSGGKFRICSKPPSTRKWPAERLWSVRESFKSSSATTLLARSHGKYGKNARTPFLLQPCLCRSTALIGRMLLPNTCRGVGEGRFGSNKCFQEARPEGVGMTLGTLHDATPTTPCSRAIPPIQTARKPGGSRRFHVCIIVFLRLWRTTGGCWWTAETERRSFQEVVPKVPPTEWFEKALHVLYIILLFVSMPSFQHRTLSAKV